MELETERDRILNDRKLLEEQLESMNIDSSSDDEDDDFLGELEDFYNQLQNEANTINQNIKDMNITYDDLFNNINSFEMKFKKSQKMAELTYQDREKVELILNEILEHKTTFIDDMNKNQYMLDDTLKIVKNTKNNIIIMVIVVVVLFLAVGVTLNYMLKNQAKDSLTLYKDTDKQLQSMKDELAKTELKNYATKKDLDISYDNDKYLKEEIQRLRAIISDIKSDTNSYQEKQYDSIVSSPKAPQRKRFEKQAEKIVYSNEREIISEYKDIYNHDTPKNTRFYKEEPIPEINYEHMVRMGLMNQSDYDDLKMEVNYAR